MKVLHKFIVVVALLLFGPMPAAAQEDCLNYEDYMHWQGYAEVSNDPDRCLGLAVADDFAYIACEGDFGVRVVYLSAPPPYPVAAYVDAIDEARDIAVSGEFAFVAAANGLAVLDISNPNAPVVVEEADIPATLPESTMLSAIAISGETACIGGYYNGGGVFYVVDISNPYEMQIGGAVLLPGEACSIVMANDNLACIAAYGAGVILVDITTPIIVGEITMQGTTRSLATDGDYVYVAAGLLWVFAMNGQLQSAVQLIDGHGAEKIVLAEEYAYITSGGSLHKVDVSNPGSPLDTGYVCSGGPWLGGDIIILDDHVYYTNEYEFHVVDCSGTCAPAVAGTVAVENAIFVETEGDYAYTVSETGDLFVLDTSSSPSPEIVGQWSPSTEPIEPKDLIITDAIAYVLWEGGIFVVDIAVPSTPTDITHIELELPNEVHQMAVAGQHVYVAWGGYTGYELDSEGGIRVIDIADIYSPQIVFDPVWGHECHHVVINDNYMYVDWRGLWFGGGLIFDITDPSLPLEVGFLQSFEDMEFAGDIAFSSCVNGGPFGVSGIAVWDNTIPREPQVIGSIPYEVSNITLEGSCLYALSNDVRVCDVAEPEHPTILGSATLPGEVQDMAFSGGYLYVAAEGAGIQIVLPQCQATVSVYDGSDDVEAENESLPAFTQWVSAYPNPFNPQTTIAFILGKPQHAKIAVYDLAGKLLNVLANRSYANGTHSVIWNGKDADDRAVPSGTYVIQLSTEFGVQTRKVMLLR